MKITLDEFDDLENLEEDNGRIKLKNNILYKHTFNMDKKHLKYLILLNHLTNHSELILPKKTLTTNNGFFGYTMNYIKDSQNIDDFLKDKHFEIDTMNIILQMFKILNIAHKYLIIGDVRNANIILTEFKAYFCDFDYSVKKNKIKLTNGLTFYNISSYKISPIYQLSPLSDTFKTFISALSLYYEVNLESLKKSHNIMIEELNDLLKVIHANKYILDYLDSLINDTMQTKTEATLDFTQIIPYIMPPSKTEKELIRTFFKN